jgi:hypothetical protein
MQVRAAMWAIMMENLVIEGTVRMPSSTGFRATDQWPDLDKFHILAMLMKLRQIGPDVRITIERTVSARHAHPLQIKFRRQTGVFECLSCPSSPCCRVTSMGPDFSEK